MSDAFRHRQGNSTERVRYGNLVFCTCFCSWSSEGYNYVAELQGEQEAKEHRLRRVVAQDFQDVGLLKASVYPFRYSTQNKFNFI